MKIVRTSPLSSAQLGLWLQHQLAPHSPAFVIRIDCRLEGPLEIGRMCQAIQAVTDASDALRSCFGERDGAPVQHVREGVQATIRVDGIPRDEEDVRFDLGTGVLFTTALLRQAPLVWIWRTDFSHLVMDGVGACAYVQLVMRVYRELAHGAAVDLSFLGTYADHLVADAAYADSAQGHEDLAYWKARHPDAGEPVIRPGRGTNRGLRGRMVLLDPETYGAFSEACRLEGATNASVLASIVATVALRHHGRRESCLGIASHGRTAAFRQTPGMFSGYLPCRLTLDAQTSMADAARQVEAQLRGDLRHRLCTARRLAQALQGEAAAPRFDIVLSHLATAPEEAAPGVDLHIDRLWGADAECAFLLVRERKGAAAEITLTYPPHLLDEDEVESFFGQVLRLLRLWPALRGTAAGEVPLLGAGDREQVLDAWNATHRQLDAAADVLCRFDRQARQRHSATALVCGSRRVSYGDLHAASLRLAHHLHSLGVGADSVVGVRLERGEQLVACLLAVLRLRAAYLPLDVAIPPERLQYMLENSAASLLVTTTSLAQGIDATRLLCLDTLVLPEAAAANDFPPADADQLAYVIYTSGSTGKPKGVQIGRRALANAMASFEHELRAGADEVLLSTTGISFDIFGLELFLPLATGACLVLAERERLLEEDYLPALARDQGATLFQATPSLLRNLLDGGWQPAPALRLLVGGEALTADVAQRLQAAAALFNVYGPTEATIWASIHQVTASGDGAPPIGRPLWNTQLYVLDGALEPVPPGVTGELYIGGMQLARGYAARPDLTAERFLPSPFAAGERIYRTGDLARWRSDGEVEYLGRADQQVKIRGHRIEPGEIESVLAAHPGVAAAVVVARDDMPGGTQLVAYYTAGDAAQCENANAEVLQMQTTAWRDIYDERYGQQAVDTSAADAAVWTSSYTGEPYPAEDIAEWAQATVDRIASLGARRVLEVGCGSGLLMSRLAPATERYVGTDISARALDLLAAGSLPQVALRHLPAHEIGALAPETFDLVIINSVVQYFPGAGYLLDVLRQAYALLAPGGHLFIGDVRNLALQPAFHASIELHKNTPAMEPRALVRDVERLCRHDSELCLAPDFFAALAAHFELAAVQVLSRRGHAATEMNAFRFDAILQRAGANVPACAVIEQQMPWDTDRWSLAHLAALLQRAPQSPFILRGVPDARVRQAIDAWNAALQGAPDSSARGGVHPEALIAAAQAAGWTAAVRATAADGSFDALLSPGDAPAVFAEPGLAEAPARLASNPLALQMQRRLEEQLQRHLAAQLPEYMVPAFFVALDQLPLTTNGKLDRRALPRPQEEAPAPVGPAPDDLEARVAGLMAQVLGLAHPPGRDTGFFALGGHSLAAVRLASRLREAFGVDFGLKAVFDAPTASGLAARLRTSGQEAATPLVVHAWSPGARIALAPAQEALWFLDRLQGANATYNMPYAYELQGPLDVPALESAFAAVVERHAVLRTVYAEDGGKPYGSIRPAGFRLDVVDAAGSVDGFVRDATRVPFDLARDAMLRARLLRLGAARHILVIVVHHIACDGLSMGILARELAALYEAAHRGRPPALQALPAQYADAALWLRNHPGPGELERQLAWWRFQLQGAPDTLQLPADRPRPPVARHRGAVHAFRLAVGQRREIEAMAGQQGVTPFSVLLAAYGALLCRLASQSEVVVGIPAGGRRQTQMEPLVGMFVNSLSLRIEAHEARTGADLVGHTARAVQEALSHADVPLDLLVQHLGASRSLNHMPLFQAMFNYLGDEAGLELPGIAAMPVAADAGTSRFDLTLQLTPDADGYAARIEYDTDLFDPPAIQRWADHYRTLLQALARGANDVPADLALLDAAQARQVVSGWNALRALPAVPADVVDSFERQARLHPGSIAVTAGGDAISYAELDARAGRLARRLRQLGAGEDTVVGLHLPRSVELMVCMLAVLKAGAAFLPLDLALPPERLAYMLDNSGARLVLATGTGAESLAAARAGAIVVDPGAAGAAIPDEPLPRRRKRESLAYLIYTSGSTGRPKGVQISHGALAVFNQAYAQDVEVRASDVSISTASISFDMFLTETLPVLCAGGRTLMADRERLLDGRYLADLVEAERATMMLATPSLVRNLVDAGWIPPAALRFILGGEAVPQDLAERLCARHALWNGFGPTEATQAQSAARLRSPVPPRPPIGSPYPGTAMYVLDARLNPVPIGVVGELYIAGEQLARGYAGRPDLTAERFLPNPFAAGERMYRTGDLVRRRADGQLEHLGRADHQVKIRGHRIELGEIESAGASHPDVAAIAVLARADATGDKRLVAYVVARAGRAVEADALRAHLAETLPAHMLPAAVVAIDRLPVTRNGKLDADALPAPDWLGQEDDVPVAFDATERKVAQLMAQVLGLDALTRPALSFFELGGHSLSAVRLAARLRESFGVDVRLKDLFESPTAVGLARLVRQEHGEGERSPFVCFDASSRAAPLFLVHGADGEAINLRELGRRLAPHAKVYGVDSVQLWRSDGGSAELNVEQLAKLYADRILADFPGLDDIRLGGWSFGGLVALEMARYLRATGRCVSTAFAIDSGLHTDASDVLECLRSREGLERAARHHLLQSGHSDADVAALLAGRDGDGFLERMDVHSAALAGYRPRRCEGPFALVLAEEGTARDARSIAAWRSAVGGGLREQTVPGTHWSILREPHVSGLSEAIAALLEQRVEVAA